MSKKQRNKHIAQSNANNEKPAQVENTLVITDDALVKKQQELKEWEVSLLQKEKELNDKSIHLEEIELQAKNGFPSLFEKRFASAIEQLKQREEQCSIEEKNIENEKEKLRVREAKVLKAEIKRDAGYSEERAALDKEFFELRQKLTDELTYTREKGLKALENKLSEIEVSRIKAIEKNINDLLKAHNQAVQRKNDEIEQERNAILKDRAELEEIKNDLEYKKHRHQSRKELLDRREASLNDEVEAKVVERKQSFENEKSQLNDEIARLRESIKTSKELISSFEELKYKLGNDDPASVLLTLKTYEEEIKELRNDLASRPTQEMQEAFDRLKSEQEAMSYTNVRLAKENEDLKKSAREQSSLEMQIAQLTEEKNSLLRRYESVDADNNRLMEDLKRLKSSYEREQDREARIRDIENPYIQKQLPRAVDEIDELQWLDGISKSCIDYGLRFPSRILKAFHTALKTSEWSTITVLAGVSGTGKSELPRLYSHFGGINFMSLSVQPNWDSQESMLGFFNSIDNKFDAQPILRLLAQTQKEPSEEYPLGLKDVMSLILLDEMNLAHVELYFAEFLSKLELRRGRKGDDSPNLEVKLGAGIHHYDLPLGRNVLWAGTMNQDETTKSLSDKVLDRGIVINFPQPTKLERRLQLKPLGSQKPLLSRKLWESWWCKESKFSDDQILPYKSFIEDMNKSLSNVGRALGHRVWQSIEYYMSNYPDVLEAQRKNDQQRLAQAMKIAFEDQLVQKVMPKLRGIETRGKTKADCLDKIRNQLINEEYTIINDFDLACEFGNGLFIWNSANYLKDDEADTSQENTREPIDGQKEEK